jgi:surface antigen
VRLKHQTIAALCLAAVVLPAYAWNTSFLREAPLAYFTDKDWSLFKDALYRALNDGADGAAVAWSNPSSGAGGEVTPLNTREVDGMRCRNTRLVSRAQGLNGQGEYLLCKTADGEWTIGGPAN